MDEKSPFSGRRPVLAENGEGRGEGGKRGERRKERERGKGEGARYRREAPSLFQQQQPNTTRVLPAHPSTISSASANSQPHRGTRGTFYYYAINRTLTLLVVIRERERASELQGGTGCESQNNTIHTNEWIISPSSSFPFIFRPSLDIISIYVLSKYQGEILKYGGVLLRRNFGERISAHVTISHSNEWRHPPYVFQPPSFWTSLDIISIYVL